MASVLELRVLQQMRVVQQLHDRRDKYQTLLDDISRRVNVEQVALAKLVKALHEEWRNGADGLGTGDLGGVGAGGSLPQEAQPDASIPQASPEEGKKRRRRKHKASGEIEKGE